MRQKKKRNSLQVSNNEYILDLQSRISLRNKQSYKVQQQLSRSQTFDFTQTEQLSCLRYKYIIGVESVHRLLWDTYILFCVLFQAVWVPLSLGLSLSSTGVFIYIQYIMTATFIADIFLNFNTSINEKGTIIRDRKKICLQYLKSWFWIDLVASFPYDFVISQSFDSDSQQGSNLAKAPQLLRLIKMLRFIRMLKLLRLAKMKQIMFRIEDFLSDSFFYVIFLMVRMAVVVFFIAHWSACSYFFIGETSSAQNEDNWLARQDWRYQMAISVQDKYITALYWATTTMLTLGFGQISAYNTYQMVIAIMIMTISCGYFAYILGKITGFISESQERDQVRTEKRVMLNRYLNQMKMPYWLHFKVKRYLDYVLKNNFKQIQQKEFMQNLSVPIRNDIYSYLYNDTLTSSEFIKKLFSKSLVSVLVRLLENQTYSPGDVIISEGEYQRKMFFLKNGKVNIFHSPTNSLYHQMTDQGAFGEIGFFLGKKRTASVICMSFCQFMTLTWERAIGELQIDELLMEHLNKVFQVSKRGDYSSLKLRCYACRSKHHIISNCDQLILMNDTERVRKEWLKGREKSKRVPSTSIIEETKVFVAPIHLNSQLATGKVFFEKLNRFRSSGRSENQVNLGVQ